MSETPEHKEDSYSLPIRRPVTMAMIFLTMVVFGLKSYQGLPLNLMPDISYPTLTVRTEYEGGAPEDIEKLVTRPLEETLSLVNGMVEISSTSSPGLSEIVLEFTWGTDMNVAQQEVRDRLDLFDPPKEVTEKPIILRYDPTLDPVLRVAITGPDLSKEYPNAQERQQHYQRYLAEIRQAAERHIKGDLEGEVGIAQVNIKGGVEKEIEILVDGERLKNLGMTFQTVNNALAQQNINLSGGSLKEGKTEFLVRTLNEYQDVDEIKDTIIGAPHGQQIRLSDVAQVFMGEKDRDTIVRIDGREAVELEIYKDGDANTVSVCRKLKKLFGFKVKEGLVDRIMHFARTQQMSEEQQQEMELRRTLKSRLPEDAKMAIISDQSRFIEGSIKEVQQTAIVGGALALLILYFFLRDLRSTLIIGVAIPISVVATFIPMFMRDISLNIMSLGGLALGIGMLVDNSIVVLESIFRCREEGDQNVDAADRGTREVRSAVTSSTLTTIAVFLPIAFVQGVAGQLFRDQALTVTFSLIASLIVALYLIPMIASRKKLALLSGESVVWMIRAYREARNERHRGRIASLLLVVPIASGYGRTWLHATTLNTFEPLVHLWSGHPDAPPPGLIRKLFRRLVALPAALFLWIVFMFMVLMKMLSFVLISFAFAIGLVIGGVAVSGLGLLKLIFWLPLELFDRSFKWLRRAYVRFLRATLKFGPVLLLVVAFFA